MSQHPSRGAPAVSNPQGLWAPGMQLMGRVNFPLKALIICLAFLVPLTWLALSFYQNKHSNIEFSAKEQQGVAYNRPLFTLLEQAQQWRRTTSAAAAGEGGAAALDADAKGKVQQAVTQWAQADKSMGAELGTTKAAEALQSSLAAVDHASGSDALYNAQSAFIDSVIGVLLQATDGSNLTLDPDIDSYYVMDAVFFRVPDVLESTARLWSVGLAVMKAGQATAEQQLLLNNTAPIAEFQVRNMKEGLAKSVAYNPDLANRLRYQDAVADAEAFVALARKRVVNGNDFSPEAQAALTAAADKALASQRALSMRLLDELDRLLAIRVAGMKGEQHLTTVVLVVGLCVAAYAFYCFFRVANGGLQQLAQHLRALAQGDLRHKPQSPWSKDETAQVLTDLAQTYDALHGLIRKVRHGARELHTASNEIAASASDLSDRTSASASALEQQASAMEQIGATVAHTAGTAQDAANASGRNAEVADRAGETIQQVVSTMQGIHASSAKINDIIGVIDGIAFQTNILALNAAVEAARAGEQGRGFAVVASEVRNLAQRSASAAKEIKDLISASVSQIDGGTRVVQSAGAIMAEVVGSARQVNTFLNEIATSAKEQAAGVEQVGHSIQELDRSTQQNAALVEETSGAALALKAQADHLQEVIADFRVA
ncbi:MAG TPA: methyl-accepting chemotaxis protein [Burkholderiaceae bacterium]|nr:methyl-accepting chemotaxis protein [Burkholderiaceae bacterium]